MTIYNMNFTNPVASYTDGNKTLNVNISTLTFELLVGGTPTITGDVTNSTLADNVTSVYTLSNGNGSVIFFSDGIDYTGTEYEGKTGHEIEYFGTLFGLSNIDTKMGESYYEEDLTTGVKKYFAEAFSFDADNFEMDGNRVVGLKQTFIDSLATDLTNIVNTSITTATLTADNATINSTLTALGINVTNLVAESVDTKTLQLTDADGHKHRVHFGN